MSYKLKEIEFRLNTWKRSREISHAYGKRSPKKFSRLLPGAVKGAKVSAIAAIALLLAAGVIMGTIKAIPWISSTLSAQFTPSTPNQGERHVQQTDESGEGDAPVIGELEATVLPEGYDPSSSSEQYAAQTQNDLPQTQPEPPPPTQTPLVDIFKAGIPAGFSDYIIFADKSAKVLYLFKNEQDRWKISRAFPMATGERHGPKLIEGDKKTPEGNYFIVGRKDRSELSVSPLYGPVAFVLDYPNEEDRNARRTGHGIWIHGSERGNIPPLHTSGCMALSNPDILELGAVLGAGVATPVIIVNGTEGKKHLTAINFQKLSAEKERIRQKHDANQAQFETIVNNWKSAWESKDIETYSQFYSVNSFRDGVQRWDAFRERKLRTFQIYSTIEVGISSIVLTDLTDNSATVKFVQVYSTNLNRLENAKRLFFTKVQGEWKITRESTFPKEEFFL
ncbi:MAG: L,D-transpeptidase family protein [Chitinispirillales bacterium]|nr:L,D-transpeptidase family protein [Chitinispirillales bacterium]